MDLRAYYRKIRQVESELVDADVVVVSHATPDGGRAGILSEVSKRMAAKLLVEGKARLATPEETVGYRSEMQDASRRAQELVAASKVQVAVISDAELKAYRSTRAQK